MKSKKVDIKKIFLILVFIVFIISAICTYFIIKCITTEKVDFDKDKLIMATSNIQITDTFGNALSSISPFGKPIISINQLNDYTINAFIAIEDKDFYKHKGLNLKRIIKAMWTNIISGYAKEGASTISQQTIKNSHLSSEKTFERKIKEMYLTLQLEKAFDKDEILEIYLNIIYFGNSCIGIEQASQTYFNVSASELSLSQSAILAGIIKSPKTYSPIINKDNCLNRRNLVLDEMFKDGYIDSVALEKAKNEPLKIDENYKTKMHANYYQNLAINEVCDILKISEKELVKKNYSIQTFFDNSIQEILDSTINENIDLFTKNNEIIENNIMINDITTGGLLAIKNNSDIDIYTTKRQPASTIKPILVYAPALEDGIISPDTTLKDEKININGYSPQNAYNGYLGNISATDALAKSCNTTSVELLNCVGIERAKEFASNLGIKFSDKDNHLGLALGGLDYGLTLENLSTAYSTFANQGKLTKIKVVKKIIDENGKVLYEYNKPFKSVISKETSYLISKMLQNTSINGTNKKLSTFSPILASKTGTNGTGYDNKNLDAYNISYNTNFCLNIWCGNTSGNKNLNLGNEYAGGNYNAILAKIIWQQLYDKYPPKSDFKKPEGVVYLDLDNIEYTKNNQLILASPQTPERYIKHSLFNIKYAPTIVSQNFIAPDAPKIQCEKVDKEICVNFSSMSYLEYTIYLSTQEQTIALQTLKGNDKNLSYSFNSDFDDIIEIYVVAEYKNFENNEIITSPKSNTYKFMPNI